MSNSRFLPLMAAFLTAAVYAQSGPASGPAAALPPTFAGAPTGPAPAVTAGGVLSASLQTKPGTGAIPAPGPSTESTPPSNAGPLSIRSGGLTIEAIASRQAREMESAEAKKMGVGQPQALAAATLTPAKPIPRRPKKPYLFSVIGPIGQEVATFVLDNGSEVSVMRGDAIGGWEIVDIDGGRLRVAKATTPKGKSKIKTPRAVWMAAGDYIK
jgi:type IV pilus biogenesis protein PilP